jgi:hypothetical protein
VHENHEEFDYDCAECQREMEESHAAAMRGYRAERERAQALALARRDLDAAGIDEWPELMDAIQRRFK